MANKICVWGLPRTSTTYVSRLIESVYPECSYYSESFDKERSEPEQYDKFISDLSDPSVDVVLKMHLHHIDNMPSEVIEVLNEMFTNIRLIRSDKLSQALSIIIGRKHTRKIHAMYSVDEQMKNIDTYYFDSEEVSDWIRWISSYDDKIFPITFDKTLNSENFNGTETDFIMIDLPKTMPTVEFRRELDYKTIAKNFEDICAND